jgi:energy-coupling factor transport system substrate-specific component
MNTIHRPTTASASSTPARRGTLRASRPLLGWRTVDLLTTAFLGAAFGIAYWGWGLAYKVPSEALGAAFAPAAALLYGPWLLAGVVGGLVVRRPGAAFACELVAALVSMLPGTQWGVDTLYSGLIEGIGAELVFALFAYRAFGPLVAALAGLVSGALEAGWEVYRFGYLGEWDPAWLVAYVAAFAFSGVVLAGGLGWLLTGGLARSGALGAFPPGQEAREARAA